jgi:hypothetical protein
MAERMRTEVTGGQLNRGRGASDAGNRDPGGKHDLGRHAKPGEAGHRRAGTPPDRVVRGRSGGHERGELCTRRDWTIGLEGAEHLRCRPHHGSVLRVRRRVVAMQEAPHVRVIV